MSLARLLSTGKSLVGGATDNANRYRMGNPGLLPKFGSGGKSIAVEAKESAPAVVEQESPKRAVEPKAKAAGELLPKKGFSMRDIFQSWLGRVKARMAKIYVKPARRDALRFAKAPMQAELSLDKVRVIRNDLSDTDLEIVPARTLSNRSEPMPGASQVEVTAEINSTPRSGKASTVGCVGPTK